MNTKTHSYWLKLFSFTEYRMNKAINRLMHYCYNKDETERLGILPKKSPWKTREITTKKQT